MGDGSRPPLLRRENLVPGVLLGVLCVGAILFVGASLGRRAVTTFPPSDASPAEVGTAKVGPRLVTIDASSAESWRFFDFSSGSVVDEPETMGWDLAFKRFQIVGNGGAGFVGAGGVLDLGEVDFDSISSVPAHGYIGETVAGDSTNAAIERWYSYSWTSHLLDPKPHVYAVRTADGRFAKLQFVGYYCPGARAGCPSFRYVYQGDGGPDVSNPAVGRH